MRVASLVALAVICTGAFAAPVPPPRRLTAEMMVGRWKYEWGGMRDGWIEFLGDGRYYSRHRPGDEPEYAGWWWIRNDVLTLDEVSFGPRDYVREYHSISYEVRLDRASYPNPVGLCGFTGVGFSDRH